MAAVLLAVFLLTTSKMEAKNKELPAEQIEKIQLEQMPPE
jgi:hypothetical protein